MQQQAKEQSQATLARFQRALKRRAQWDGLLSDAYRFALPNHDADGYRQSGENRHRDVFDNTAVTALAQKKARLHGQLFPPFRDWMEFDLSLDLGAGKEDLPKEVTEWLEMAQKRFHRAIEASNFHIEIDPALAEACISTGCLMVRAGSADQPLNFEAVPISQLVPEEGSDGMLRTVFRRWQLTGQQLMGRWPDAAVPADVQKQLDQKPDQKMTVLEAFLDQPEKRQAGAGCLYQLFLLSDGAAAGQGTMLLERSYARSPMIMFRMDKAPGEWMGRGPVLNVLGDIKTANKVVELVLKNASIAVTGIWQAEDDGVLNPANIHLKPGTIIPKAVGSSGLQPLKPAGQFDVSQLILSQLQQSIRDGIMGPALPPSDARVRTAFELDVRQSEQLSVELPSALRLLSELDLPLGERILSILLSPEMAGSPYYIPPLSLEGQDIRPMPKSPLIRLQERADAERQQQSFVQAQQAFPDLVDAVVDRKALLRTWLKLAGFPAAHFKAEAAEDKLVEAVALAGEALSQELAEAEAGEA